MEFPCKKCTDILKPLCFSKDQLYCSKISKYLQNDPERKSEIVTKRMKIIEDFFNKKIFLFSAPTGYIAWQTKGLGGDPINYEDSM